MIAYDTNLLIYALEGVSPFAPAAQMVVRKGEEEGAVLSVLAWQELITGIVLRGQPVPDAVRVLQGDFVGTKFISVTQAIVERALELTAHHGRHLFGYDAIHLATALESGSRVFITNDAALRKLTIEGLVIQGLD